MSDAIHNQSAAVAACTVGAAQSTRPPPWRYRGLPSSPHRGRPPGPTSRRGLPRLSPRLRLPSRARRRPVGFRPPPGDGRRRGTHLLFTGGMSPTSLLRSATSGASRPSRCVVPPQARRGQPAFAGSAERRKFHPAEIRAPGDRLMARRSLCCRAAPGQARAGGASSSGAEALAGWWRATASPGKTMTDRTPAPTRAAAFSGSMCPDRKSVV